MHLRYHAIAGAAEWITAVEREANKHFRVGRYRGGNEADLAPLTSLRGRRG